MNENLNRFYNDEYTREDVKSYFLETLDMVALERVYEGEDTKGIADAKEVIEKAFVDLGDVYGKKKETLVTNEAR